MTRVRPLDAHRHRAWRFDAARAAATRTLVQIGLSEVALAAADMPVCLAKDATTGRFNLVALMGLAGPANLFATATGLAATYMPQAALLAGFRLDPAGVAGLAVDEATGGPVAGAGPGDRGPGAAGFGDGGSGAAGTPLFDADGAPAAVLGDIHAALERLVADVAAAQALVDDHAARRLVRPLRLVLRHADGAEHALDGLYTVGPEALRTLDDTAVVALHRAGRLAPAAVMAASLAQFERLRQLHDATQPHAIASIVVEVEE